MVKLVLKNPKAEQPDISSTPPPSSAQSTSGPKLKLNFGAKPSSEDAVPSPAASKQGKRRPSTNQKGASKAGPSKKRSRDAIKDEADAGSSKKDVGSGPIKRIKLSTKAPKPVVQSFRIKTKGEPLHRPKGVGYDSEAEDTEIDPALEENFILRMQPGEDCDYLRQAVAEKRFGPRSQGGADVSFKSLTRDGRRATVTIQGRIYAASLVDLPCIIESLKSWDKRGWYKAADICQMLLVLGRVNTEDEARNYPLPREVEPSSFRYAHGITPPLKYVRKRRFRRRISHRTIEAVEMEVARLHQEDQAAIEPPAFELIDYNEYMREASAMQSEDGLGYSEAEGEYDDEQDAEGEMDEYGADGYAQPEEGVADEFEDDLAAEMEAALEAHADSGATPAAEAADEGSVVVEAAPGTETEADLFEGEVQVEAETPITKQGETSGDEDEESEESSPEDANADLDEDALARQNQLQEQREEIAELEAELLAETTKLEQTTNTIIRSKIAKRVQQLRQALDLKKVSIGEGGDS